MSEISHLLLVFNSSINILIYCWNDKTFRKVLLAKVGLTKFFSNSENIIEYKRYPKLERKSVFPFISRQKKCLILGSAGLAGKTARRLSAEEEEGWEGMENKCGIETTNI